MAFRALLLPLVLLAPALLAGCASPDAGDGLAPADAASGSGAGPLVVVAHLDTGINPYHRAFRDESPLAWTHPSAYLAGFPADAPALSLSLNETDWKAAVEKDKAVWDGVKRGTLYWIPGTRIVGAITFGLGGANCPLVDVPPLNLVGGDCPDRPILDDHGHGTMTASRMAAARHSLAPAARIVSVEGPSGAAVRWAADAGWIDVQSNSWLGLVPPPLSQHADGTSADFAYAAARMATFAASGNGAAYLMGFAPTPTWVLSTAAPGVILVGAHDNGHFTAWSGAPAHVLADGYGGPHAFRDSMDALAPSGVACCTSAASPYAAGGGAAILLEARRILGDNGTGLRGGALAVGEAPFGIKGPLADGRLTLGEFRALLYATATPRPKAGPDDGALHWMANGTAPAPDDPAGNPYCVGCWTAPIPSSSVPEGPALVWHEGYGAIDPASVARAAAVLRGEQPAPARPLEDAFFAADAQARAVVFRNGTAT